MNCLNCQNETTNPKFCSQSCAAIFNNKMKPKRSPEGQCEKCLTPIKKCRKYCTSCFTSMHHPGGRPKAKPQKYCLNCKKPIRSSNTFCNQKCSIEYKFNQQVKLVEQQGYIYLNRTHTSAPFAKRYLKYKYGDKCAICGIGSTWNDKPITLITDHINGHHDDWSLNNLRLVCPNCDSQLSTYKSKNKGNGRKNRTW